MMGGIFEPEGACIALFPKDDVDHGIVFPRRSYHRNILQWWPHQLEVVLKQPMAKMISEFLLGLS